MKDEAAAKGGFSVAAMDTVEHLHSWEGLERSQEKTEKPKMLQTGSFFPVPLFLPRIAVVVVAVNLPQAGLVGRRKAEPAYPLGALPEVDVGDKHAGRPAVLGFERLAVVAEGDPRLAARGVLERDVGRVAAVGELDDVLGRRLDPVEQRVDGDALPDGVELRPLCDERRVTIGSGTHVWAWAAPSASGCRAPFAWWLDLHPGSL